MRRIDLRHIDGTVAIDVEAANVEFEEQDYSGGDERTRNINHLGTDFLNNVVLLDDYIQNLFLF